MKYLSLIAFAIVITASPIVAKNNKKNTAKRVAQIKTDIEFLASEKLEGRRTGSMGEKIAAQYIADRMKAIGITPLWKENYLQTYKVVTGKQLSDNTILAIFTDTLGTKQFVPMPFSGNGQMSELVLPKVNEQGSFALVPISTVTKKLLSSPHDEALAEYEKKTTELIENGAKGIIYYNDIDAEHDYAFDPKAKSSQSFSQIVVFVNYEAVQKYIQPKLKADWIDFYGNIQIEDNIREGRNVGGFIDNGSATTVIIGAHFDHLGYGEDHNSLFAGKEPQIHNGADDNASGVAAMLTLAEMLKTKPFKNNNYMLLSFSGEELGLYGSKKFTEMNSELLEKANYMVNIDMLGRYDETKKSITVGGVGTSPSFVPIIEKSKPFFTPKYDSAGIGPSDHTSFYMKNIPVLFFFTGLHSDYHKPSDDADKINFVGEEKLVRYIYKLIGELNKKDKLDFTKTREKKMDGVGFKVTLGIMPDYTFSGNGVRADGITDGKVGSKAGMKAGDIITQLGDYKILDMQSYMVALSKFKKGDATKVKVLRAKEELEMNVVFE